MTKQELEKHFDNFLSQFNNASVDFDGYYGAQCVDLVQTWSVWELGGSRFIGDFAYQIYGQLPAFYDSIENTLDNFPLKGDIVVWQKEYNGYAGHTGIATGKGDIHTFDCFEQNDPTGSVSHVRSYNYNFVQGWLKLKVTSSQQQPMQIDFRAGALDLIAKAYPDHLGVGGDSTKVSADQATTFVEWVKSNVGRAGKWDSLYQKSGGVGDSNQATVDELYDLVFKKGQTSSSDLKQKILDFLDKL